jgi:hypothetical protein
MQQIFTRHFGGEVQVTYSRSKFAEFRLCLSSQMAHIEQPSGRGAPQQPETEDFVCTNRLRSKTTYHDNFSPPLRCCEGNTRLIAIA